METCLDSEHGVVELHGPERQHASKQVSKQLHSDNRRFTFQNQHSHLRHQGRADRLTLKLSVPWTRDMMLLEAQK